MPGDFPGAPPLWSPLLPGWLATPWCENRHASPREHFPFCQSKQMPVPALWAANSSWSMSTSCQVTSSARCALRASPAPLRTLRTRFLPGSGLDHWPALPVVISTFSPAASVALNLLMMESGSCSSILSSFVGSLIRMVSKMAYAGS